MSCPSLSLRSVAVGLFLSLRCKARRSKCIVDAARTSNPKEELRDPFRFWAKKNHYGYVISYFCLTMRSKTLEEENQLRSLETQNNMPNNMVHIFNISLINM